MANIKRLEELAVHLEEGVLGHEVFDFGTLNNANNRCGTAGCAIGECPILWPKYWEFSDKSTVKLIGRLGNSDSISSDSSMEWFDIDTDEENHLFYPNWQHPRKYGGKYLTTYATRQDVAANIRAFIKIKTA